MLRRSFESVSTMLGIDARDASSSARDLFSSRPGREEKKYEVLRSDSDDGISLPNVIVAEGEELEDLFAVIAAYHPLSSPLTAFSHIVSPNERALNKLVGKEVRKRSTRRKATLIEALVGASAGEAALAAVGLNDAGATTYASCRRTLSFALARSIEVHGDLAETQVVMQRWIELRQLAGLKVSNGLPDAVKTLCAAFDVRVDGGKDDWELSPRTVCGILEGEVAAVSEFRRLLADRFIGVEKYALDLKSSFDGRLSAFTGMVASIYDGNASQTFKDFSVAYFCDQILQGSFSHTSILGRFVAEFPSSMVWYGAIAASGRRSATSKIKSILDKLHRDVTHPFSYDCRPTCDVSVEELIVISRAGLKTEALRPSHPRTLSVSLVPGVDVYARQPGEPVSPDVVQPPARASEPHAHAIRLIEQALKILTEVKAQPLASEGRYKRRKST